MLVNIRRTPGLAGPTTGDRQPITFSRVTSFVFGTHNAAFVQVMYEQYLRDPASVGEEWRQLFDNGKLAELPVIPTNRSEVIGSGEQGAVPSAAPTGTAPRSLLPASPGLTPITGPAARLVQNMTDSLSVPTATSFREITVDVLDARRRELNAQLAAAGKKVSYTHLIGYAITRAARELPVMTHAFQDVDGKPHRFDPRAVNLGLAVDVEKKDGSHALVVPVIKHAEGMDFATFHATYETLVDKARTNKLVPDDFAGATITLTNPGTIGTVASVPRLMKGQGSIIATGAIRTIGGAKVMTITSTYDHRIIQGAESGLFLRRLDELLQGEENFYGAVLESLGLPGGETREAGEVVATQTAAPGSRLPAPDELKHVAAAMALVKAIRNFGHTAARLDPLGSDPPGDPALDPGPLGLSPEIMARIPADLLRIYVPGRTLAEAYPRLQETYCGTIAYEVEHIGSHQERVWLRQVIESGDHRKPLSPEMKRQLLARLTAVETLERFLHKAYLGQKRFSIEGLDVLVPMLDQTIELAGASGARRVVLGMAHRGRLNVLAHVVGLPYETIFAEFEGGRHVEGTLTPEGGTGNVKYNHNADDAEACLAAVRLAMLYRDKFHGDVVIDVVGYRRWGHNEGDEPAYTQPVMYERIRQTPTARRRYADQLVRERVVDAAQAAAEAEQVHQRLMEIQQSLKAHLREAGAGEEPQRISGAQTQLAEPDTAVSAPLLTTLNEQLLLVPEGFTIIPKLQKQLERRRTALAEGQIEWAHAEALAFASLVAEGTAIRLTGQDTERGTFSQRHLVLRDARDGRRYTPIQNLPGARAPFELHNSPLSEFACLGFEYGYAAAAPETLVLWEAQYGDFTNGGEVIIDQFIIAGLAKWGQTSRLTLLLPHGYEGQGPEHSSARIERFLALGADGNIRIANCTTPAQYFHLLRRQARHAELRPLVLFTPKSLLRLPQASSRLEELATGRFQPVLDDPAAPPPDAVRRLILCSGKVYYDLTLSPARAQAQHVAVARVELLYPFPREELATLIRQYPNLREIVWVQEEPRNMGPQKFMLPQLRELVGPEVTVRDIGRPERSSPAEGYPAAHQVEQARIVAAAFAPVA